MTNSMLLLFAGGGSSLREMGVEVGGSHSTQMESPWLGNSLLSLLRFSGGSEVRGRGYVVSSTLGWFPG